MIVALGTPCGGTTFVTALLRAHGLDVGHEEVRKDGIVCGFAALGGKRRGTWAATVTRDVDTVIRIVRDPLDTAETLPAYTAQVPAAVGEAARKLRTEMRAELRAHPAVRFRPELEAEIAARPWYSRHPALRTLERREVRALPLVRADEMIALALRYWVEAHEAIPRTALVLRLARLDEDWPAIARAIGVEPRAVRPTPRSKARRWPRWTWEQWAAADPAMAARGRVLWDRYGTPDARDAEDERLRAREERVR